MDDWYRSIASETHLPPSLLKSLGKDGFVVIPGPVPAAKLSEFADSYNQAIIQADPADVAVGGTTTRVTDFVNRFSDFDDLYIYSPILEACCRVIEQPFKLSTMHARTLRPRRAAQKFHVDFAKDAQGWPMVGFIFMIDEFRPENGATLFAPGSQGAEISPPVSEFVPACGPAGSIVVFNGSMWHGHGANETDEPRRSIQGAYIRRTEKAGVDLLARMRSETLGRLGSLARYLLTLETHPEGNVRRGVA